MSIRKIATRQYRAILDRHASAAREFALPPEGWIATTRKALGMSGTQLAARLGLGRARISQAELAERAGAVSLKTLQAAAAAMNCRLVYAFVPNEGAAQDLVMAQARRQATALVGQASEHMALEQQALTPARNAAEIERLAADLARDMPADFWTD